MIVQEAGSITDVTEEALTHIPLKRLYKAGELSRRTGLTRQALHQYVLMGLLEPDDVTKGGQRLFSDRAEALVKLIRRMCENGYTLKDVKDIFIKSRA